MTLSPEDLDRIEEELREGIERGGGEEWYSNVALPLVAEVRRLQADRERVRDEVQRELSAVKGRQPLADEFPGATWALARVLGFIDQTAEPAAPASLDTGRWRPFASGSRYVVDGAGMRESILVVATGELWHKEAGPEHLSADDLEAAARIVRANKENTDG
jgi:hypothetical protein